MNPELYAEFQKAKRKANPIGFNLIEVDDIKKKISLIKLPIFDELEKSRFLTSLDNADKKFRGDKLEIRDKFVFLIDVFRFLYAIHENDKKLKIINDYLLCFNHFIKQILSSYNKSSSDRLLIQSTNQLKFELDMFCAKYYYFIEQKETNLHGSVLDNLRGK